MRMIELCPDSIGPGSFILSEKPTQVPDLRTVSDLRGVGQLFFLEQAVGLGWILLKSNLREIEPIPKTEHSLGKLSRVNPNSFLIYCFHTKPWEKSFCGLPYEENQNTFLRDLTIIRSVANYLPVARTLHQVFSE